jgi:hypothetical protein
MDKTKKILIGGGLILYLVVAGVSYAIFGYFSKESGEATPVLTDQSEDGGLVSPSGPKEQECPINGAYFTKAEEDVWSTRRPLAVMIENHVDSRPQSGLSRADVVYEAVAEGGITRLLAVFYCGAAWDIGKEYDIGPVRSARTYFLDWASEYGDYPLYAHVGGAGECTDNTVYEDAKALCQIRQYDWMNEGTWSDLNQFSLSYEECRRDTRLGTNIATEHTMYCDLTALWEKASDRGLDSKTVSLGTSWDKNFRSWLFKEEEKLADRGEMGEIGVYFWKNQPQYDVAWQYDRENNHYLRYNGGAPYKDFINNETLAAKVVVVQLTRQRGPVDDKKHLLYDTLGEGRLLVFQDGQVTEGTWEKEARTSRTRFFDDAGAEIRLNRGLVWIEIVPATNAISY